MIAEECISYIPGDMAEHFNKLFPMDDESFASELAETKVLQTAEDEGYSIRYGVRKVDGAPIILLRTSEEQFFVFLPEGSN